MEKIVFIFILSFTLLACTETWQGVKKDSKTIAESVGKAANELGDEIGKTLKSDKDKDSKGEN